MMDAIAEFSSGSRLQILITALVVAAYFVLDRFSTPRIEEGADQGRFKDSMGNHAVIVARSIIALFGTLLLVIVWGVDLGSLLVFATTAMTLLGVALFASWSLLSNITAFFVLLLHPSYRRGNFIRIIDLDNYIEGYISDITLFNTRLVTENREVIVYPNNLMLAKPTLINPRDRLNVVGKIAVEKAEDEGPR